MINIELLEISGIRSALNALRLPFGKECRSEVKDEYIGWANEPEIINFNSSVHIDINPKDLLLMSTLVKRGDEHAKVVRGIIAYAEITAPVYWWCEMECYRAGHERLCSESTMHTDCRGLTGDELVNAKSEIPMGRMLKKIDYFSYQCLRTIVKQRHNHRLPEWHSFIEWIKTLPFADELILKGIDSTHDDDN